MSDNWRILYGEGSDQLIIDAHARFDLQMRATDDDSGRTIFKEFFIEVEGDVVESSPALVTSRLDEILTAARTNTPKRCQIQLDGVTKFDFKTTDFIGSPKILFFKTVPEDGNADSHWRYAMTIYAREPGGQGTEDGVTELATSILVVTEKGNTIRKVWRATAKGQTLARALAQVISFRPRDKFIREEIERFFQERRVTAAWTWEKRKTDKILSIEEDSIEYEGFGADYAVDTQIGDPSKPPLPPLLHRKPQPIIRAIVRGVVRGFADTIAAPAPHFSESNNVTRWRAAEQVFFPAIEDAEKGIWRLPYTEVWLITGNVPKPNHGDHAKIIFAKAPADGAMANQ